METFFLSTYIKGFTGRPEKDKILITKQKHYVTFANFNFHEYICNASSSTMDENA